MQRVIARLVYFMLMWAMCVMAQHTPADIAIPKINLPKRGASPRPTKAPAKQSTLNAAILKTYDTDPVKDNKKRYEAVLALIGKKEVVDSINKRDEAGGIALLLAADRGYTDIVRLLIQKIDASKINVNVNDKSGWTALILAARGGHKDVVELLVNSGAKVNKGLGNTKDGATALDFTKDAEIKSFLKSKGAKTKTEITTPKE